MQTIKITITSPTPKNIVLKESISRDKDFKEKLGEMFKRLLFKQRDERNETM